ncbi:Tfp pilus assembly protein FimT/FimU [Salinispirillum marinum]|uniref:Tfp pilus assembly protein FimT/FimU n=2 Tax=Saccharospirillaceae TaxID=255527 RepID=A0ABV8BGN6_9GAMM
MVRSTCSRYHDHGFTLIELMVVLVLISVVGGMVVLSLGNGDRERRYQRELTGLQQFVAQAYNRARLENQTMALQWHRDGVTLMRLSASIDEQGNPLIGGEVTEEWQTPDALLFQLSLAEQAIPLGRQAEANKTPEHAHWHILPDGTSERPWAVSVVWEDDLSVWQRLLSDGLNPPQWRWSDG